MDTTAETTSGRRDSGEGLPWSQRRIPLPTTDDTMATGTISGMMTTGMISGTIFAAKRKSYRFLRIPS